MYTEFYGLHENPFDLTPSPHYLYLSETHREALALLKYGVMERKGFVLLTGEVGTGKTTIVKTLLAGLGEDVQCVYLSNPRLKTSEFLEYLSLAVFKEKEPFKSKAKFLVNFEAFLREKEDQGRDFILIVDEAQNVSYRLLEDIRLLSNMGGDDRGLVSIFLVGQPELNLKLNRPQCRPVQQRISMRYHIEPLNRKETREYVAERLRTAGKNNGADIFPRRTLTALHKYSKGYPRMINVLADNALLLGYSSEKSRITPAMVKASFNDTRTRQGRRRSLWKYAALFAALLLLAGAFGITRTGQDIPKKNEKENTIRKPIEKRLK